MTVERMMAGHRVLRLLAQGERSRVWLAAGDVALKRLDEPVPIGQPGLEADALHRARGEHVIELLDLSLGRDGAVLVFPRLPRGSLADLLSRRAALDAGEAVTMLAPIAACLARIHAAGVAHTALAPACVLFSRDGAPVLTGFGGAELFEPGLAEVHLERVAGVEADRAALLGLADVVLARVTGQRGKIAARLREELRVIPADRLTELLTTELFELAAARPVRFEADAPDASDTVPRLVPVARPVQPEPHPAPALRMAWAERLLAAGPGAIVRGAVRERWAGWSTRRRRATIASGAAVLALVVAMSVLPGTAQVPAAAPAASPASTGAAAPDATTGDEAVIAGDDPIAALGALAARRDRCFAELSVLCLDGVDEVGSSAFDADRAAIREVIEGGVIPSRLQLASAALVERLGDSALIELRPDSDPASVLLLKGEAGWRIRDYLTGGGSSQPE